MLTLKKLNLTIGVFDFAFSDMFSTENGQTRTTLKALRSLLNTIQDHGNFKIRLKLGDKLGHATDQGTYESGVLGMLQRQEVDVGFLPIPFDIPNAPGNFSPVIHDDNYHIYSYPKTKSWVTQNIASSLETINLSLWLMMLLLLLILEAFHHLTIRGFRSGNNKINKFCIFTATLRTLGPTVFGHYLPERSLIRTAQLICIIFFTITLSASFKTNTIVGNDEVKVETLKDVITLNKKPLYLEGESTIELFELGVTPDYAKIYQLARERGTANAIPLSALDVFYELGSDTAYFCSNEIARAVNKLSKALGVDQEYKSSKPYHQALEGFLCNPGENSMEIKRRIFILATRQFQGNLFIMLLRRIINELLVKANIGINENQMILTDEIFDLQNFSYQPLSLDGCKVIFISWAFSITTAMAFMVLELIFFI